LEEYDANTLRKLLVEIAGEVAGYMRDIAGIEGLDEVLRIGASGDQTRKADRIAEDIAIDLIKHEKIPVKIVTEESGIIETTNNPEYVIIMDPLDGSMNYVSLIPFAAVSIAIAPMNNPYFSELIAGAIANIFLGEIYSFSDNKIWIDNTFYQGSGKNMGSIVVYTGNPKFFKILNSFIHDMPGYRLRILGSASLELAYVGLGRVSMFYNDTGKLRNVDIAAAAGFVIKAGYTVVNVNGLSIDFRVDDLYRIDSLIAGKREFVEKFLMYLKSHGYF